MNEEDELEVAGALTKVAPKRFDLVQKLDEMQTQIAGLHQEIGDLREHIGALTRVQMNRPMIDHSADAIAGMR